MPLEFRVRYQRGDRQPHTIIYQDWGAACRKVQSVKAMDEIKADTERFEDMPDLTSVELQVREVGEWRRHDYQPPLTDHARERMRERLYYRYGEGCPKDASDSTGVPF